MMLVPISQRKDLRGLMGWLAEELSEDVQTFRSHFESKESYQVIGRRGH